MRFPLLALIFLSCASVLQAQQMLTFSSNGIGEVDSCRYLEIFPTDAGLPGSGRTWDFRDLVAGERISSSHVSAEQVFVPEGLAPFNRIFIEQGFQYFLDSGEEGIAELGYAGSNGKMIMKYTDPLQRLKFPFRFRDSFTDLFGGTAWYNGKSRIDVAGSLTVEADGEGILMLPGTGPLPALRLKMVRRALHADVCGSTIIETTRYSWYISGHRFPVLILSETRTTHADDTPVVAGRGYVIAGFIADRRQTATANDYPAGAVYDVMVYPNPFSRELHYRFELPRSLRVTVELCDLSGIRVASPASEILLPPGLHNFSFNSGLAGLPPGIYYLRFIFDREVIIRKVVKVS